MIRAAIIALAALALAVPSAHAETKCGEATNAPDTAQDIRATHVTCTKAKQLARHHMRTRDRGQRCDLRKASCVLDGYTCRRTFFGNSGTRVRCASGMRLVRFFYGV
jgi:hypothetical protein